MSKVFVIAEAGVNHNGNIEIAKRLVDAAVWSKADAVKFQTFKAEKIASKNAPKARYQYETAIQSETQYEMLKRLELTEDMHRELIKYCREKGIIFLSSPFDMDSIDLLARLGLEIIKIPSGEITNLPYLRAVAQQKKQVILSTGMSDLQEVKEAVQILNQYGTNNITILHCNTQYPTPMDDVNLKAMVKMGEELKLPYGYSDHTLGIEIPVAATALGATVIEKHFTLDKAMKGPDHKVSLEPMEFRMMVQMIRNVENALGDGLKKVTQSEKNNVMIGRKSIVAARSIKKGDYFTPENITIKRPGKGISPMEWDTVIGKISNRDYEEDEIIEK